jgi:hypothetical protein
MWHSRPDPRGSSRRSRRWADDTADEGLDLMDEGHASESFPVCFRAEFRKTARAALWTASPISTSASVSDEAEVQRRLLAAVSHCVLPPPEPILSGVEDPAAPLGRETIAKRTQAMLFPR